MKIKTPYRYPFFKICFLIFAAVCGIEGSPNPNIYGHETDVPRIAGISGLQKNQSSDIGIPAKTFYAVLVDNNNHKWFLTELGIISFSGEKWTLHNENKKIAAKIIRDIAYKNYPGGTELWIATPNGASVTNLPFDAGTETADYLAGDTSIQSNNVNKVTAGNGPITWFGTDKGISALSKNKWLTPSYEETYPQIMFKDYPITSMAANANGDSLYAGTDGAGVARVFRNDVDGISGASAYAQWGPIIIPSDKVYCIFIAPDGKEWFGTDQGAASHSGNNTLENWTVYSTDDGLVNNFVQAITADNKGDLWFGTRGGGISVFNGSEWISYTTNDGLNSNNILCLTVDREGVVWIGTDNGVACYNNGNFITYR